MKIRVKLFAVIAALILSDRLLFGMSGDRDDLGLSQEIFVFESSPVLELAPVVQETVCSVQEQEKKINDKEEDLEVPSKRRKIVERISNSTKASASMQIAQNASSWREANIMYTDGPLAIEQHVIACELSLDNIISNVLSRSPHIIRLKVIAGRNCQITSEQIQLIGEMFPNLKELNLSRTFLSDEGLSVLAQQAFAPHLNVLIISSNEVTAYGVMTSLGKFTNLVSLDISGNLMIGTFGFAELVELPFASKLAHLKIARANIGERGINYIARKLTSLVSLDISGNLIGDDGLEILAAQPFACNLSLTARSVNATEEWLKHNKHKFKQLIIS